MNLTEESVLKSIQAKSDQLNAVDLVGGPVDVVIESVNQGSEDQPWIIKIKGNYQPYKPGLSMRRVLVACWGTKVASYVGRSMRLFCDPSVKWAGEEAGGIRISHLTHIEKAVTVMLNVSRGKKKPWTVHPLELDTETRVLACIDALDKCKSKASIDKVLGKASKLLEVCNEDQKNRIDVKAKEVEKASEAKQ